MVTFMYGDLSEAEDALPRAPEELTPSSPAYLRARGRTTWSLNPTTQLVDRAELAARDVYQQDGYYLDEFGNQVPMPRGLDPADPRARRLSLDEANERGKDVGLRFSDEPTQAQFDYLAQMKRTENERAAIMDKAPSSGAWATGFLSDLAITAVDPLNAASAFVPVVGEARYMRMVSQYGKGPARLLKGGAEGFVGAGLVTPIVYAQAQSLQQNYDAYSAMADLAVGTVLGSGLHWAGGRLMDRFRGEKFIDINKLREKVGETRDRLTQRDGRRAAQTPEGENATLVAAMKPEARRDTLASAVASVSRDRAPKVDAILAGQPEMRSIAMPDRRFPATQRLRSPITSADYAIGSPGARIMDELARTIGKGDAPPVRKLMSAFSKRYTKLGETKLAELTPEQFQLTAANLLEHPDQKVVYDPQSKKLLVTDGATPGAIRHEIERAIDDLYGAKGEEAGGYRFDKRDGDGPVALRQAIAEQYRASPERAPTSAKTGKETLDLFSRDTQDITNVRGDEADARNWEKMNEDKDKDLETLIKDEEIDAIKSVADINHGLVRDLGIIEKVIPAEERKILGVEEPKVVREQIEKDLFSAVDEAVQTKEVNEALDDAELLIKSEPAQLLELIRGAKTAGELIADNAKNHVTRQAAGRSIYLHMLGLKDEEGNAIELSGDKLEVAIKLVQDGENIDVAVNAALGKGGDLLARAEKASTEPVTKKALDEEDIDDMDLEELALKILDEGMIKSKRELAEFEERVVMDEQRKLAENPATEDLFNDLEVTEFNEAHRNRALREGAGAATKSERIARELAGERQPLANELFTTSDVRDGAPTGGSLDVVERERSAVGGERSAPETTQSYGGWAVPRRVITPDGSIEVTVQPKIVELDTLIHATGDLQVRDRSRKESSAEAFERASNLDPEQLIPTRVADAGAPIVVADKNGRYVLISGNGRVLSIRQVYNHETLVSKAREYRERIGPAADGYRRPVLVSEIVDDLSHSELVRFAERANRSRIAEMSVTEKAQRDASVAGYDIMSLYQGGDFTKRENQPFLRAFMRKVATTQELGEMSKNGVLTKTGVDRLNAAVLAAAYDDASVLSLMLESADLNIKSIANAYRDVAPDFMRLRAEIAQGVVREDMDITAQMMEAARFVQKARDEGIKVGNALAQVDVFSPLDPVVEKLVRQFYNPEMKRANSALRISEVLRRYADIAKEKKTGGFFEDSTGAGDVFRAAEQRAERELNPEEVDDIEALVASNEAGAGPSAGGERAGAPQPAPQESRAGSQEPGSRADAAGSDRPVAEKLSDKLDSDIVSAYKKARGKNPSEQWVTLEDLRSEISGHSRQDIDAALKRLFTPDANGKRSVDLITWDDQGSITDSQRAAALNVGASRMDRISIPEASAATGLRATLDAMNLTELRAYAKDNKLQAKDRAKAKLVDKIIAETEAKAKPATEAPAVPPRTDRTLSDEQIDALPDPTAGEPKPFVDPAQRRVFYDLLEGDQPVKGAGTVAKALKISVEEAGHLIDEAIDAGWLKYNSKDQIIRVERDRRPGRPDEPDAFADNSSIGRDGTILGGDGEPLILYHGSDRGFGKFSSEKLGSMTGAPSAEEGFFFTNRRKTAEYYSIGKSTNRKVADRELAANRKGLERELRHYQQMGNAEKVAEIEGKLAEATGPIVKEVNLTIKNPYVYDFKGKVFRDETYANIIREAKAAGHDGVILKNTYDAGERSRIGAMLGGRFKSEDIYVVFSSDQIKDAGGLRRPARPDEPDAFADVVGFRPRSNAQRYRFLMDRSQEISSKINELFGERNELFDSDRAEDPRAYEINREIDDLRSQHALYQDELDVLSNKRGDVLRDFHDKNETNYLNDQLREAEREEKINREFVDGLESIENPDFVTTRNLQIAREKYEASAAKVSELESKIAQIEADASRIEFANAPRGWDVAETVTEDAIARVEREFQAVLSIQKAFGQSLHRVPEVIKLQMMEPMHNGHFNAAAMYSAIERAIKISREIGKRKPGESVPHEIFHSLRSLKLFTENEWAMIRQVADSQKLNQEEIDRFSNYRNYYAEEYAKRGLNDPQTLKARVQDKLAEEWAATEYGKWQEARDKDRESFMGRLFTRVDDFITDLGNAFKRWSRGKDGPVDHEEIFRAIEDGTIAKRWQEWGGGKAGADNPLSVRSFAIADMADDLNAQMRALAKDDNESLGNKTAEALASLAPCASYNL